MIAVETIYERLGIDIDLMAQGRGRQPESGSSLGEGFHLRGAPGLDAYEHEAVGFPLNEHDDRVDAMVYAADLNAASEFYFVAARR